MVLTLYRLVKLCCCFFKFLLHGHIFRSYMSFMSLRAGEVLLFKVVWVFCLHVLRFPSHSQYVCVNDGGESLSVLKCLNQLHDLCVSAAAPPADMLLSASFMYNWNVVSILQTVRLTQCVSVNGNVLHAWCVCWAALHFTAASWRHLVDR